MLLTFCLRDNGNGEENKSLRLSAIITGASGYDQKQANAMHALSKSEEDMAQERGETNSSRGGVLILLFCDLSNTLLVVPTLCKHVIACSCFEQ